jgi:Lipoate-protein ligase A
MRLLRGRAATPDEDRAVTDRLVEAVGETGQPAARVWQPHRQVAFGRRDTSSDAYGLARDIAVEHGFDPTERSVGGRAVAYTGTTVAFVRATPVEEARTGIDDRYETATNTIVEAVSALGGEPTVGEPAGSFCPGTHSLSATGKLAGLAQRVRRDVAVLGGILIVRDHKLIADVLEPVYAALGIAFDPDTVGSLARASGVTDPTRVITTLGEHLATDTPEVSWVEDSHVPEV